MENFLIISLFSFIFLVLYFYRRVKKVKELRLSLIDFYTGDKVPENQDAWKLYLRRREWFNSLPPFERMCWSFKPLKYFITGEFSGEALEYLKNNGRIN